MVLSRNGLLLLHLGYLLQPRNGLERPVRMTIVSPHSSQEISVGIGLGLGLTESVGRERRGEHAHGLPMRRGRLSFGTRASAGTARATFVRRATETKNR
mgnify:CR=1 FL=1